MSGQRIGYIRVNTLDQHIERQLEGIEVDKIFLDKVSGKDTKRPQLDLLMSLVRGGDTVLMLSVMGAFAEFERALIKERQHEGIAQAKKRGAFKGRKKSLSQAEIAEVRRRIANGRIKAQVAREFGISRQTLYQYLRGAEGRVIAL